MRRGDILEKSSPTKGEKRIEISPEMGKGKDNSQQCGQ